MSRREPMSPIAGLKKPDLPAPTARPRTLRPVPAPATGSVGEAADVADVEEVDVEAQDPAPATTTDDETPPSSDPSTTKTRTRTRRPPRSASADTTKPVSVSVPLTLAESWRDRAKVDHTSQVDVLLDALVTHQDELADLISQRTETPTINDGLFDRRPSTARERYLNVSLRIMSRNLQVIDQLTKKHGAKNRSQLIAAALTAYLA